MNDRFMQTIVFLGSLAGYVVLALRDLATAEYVALVGPVLAAVILKSHLGQQDEHLEKQDKKLDTITHQTNGVLTQRINDAVADGVKAALAQREGTDTL